MFMPPLEQAFCRRCDLLMEGRRFKKEESGIPTAVAYAIRSFRQFFRTVEYCF
jgi:hypothetical protein